MRPYSTAVGLLGVVLGGRRREGLGGAAAVPVLLAAYALGDVGGRPLGDGGSQQMEMRAGVGALRFTRDPEGFVAMQRELAVRSLADPTPLRWSQFWWGSHPTFSQRVEIARRVAAQR